MSGNALAQAEPIRMVFELSREDHPRLYDELIRFPKGTKRINRLRVLAYDGLLVQVGRAMSPARNEHEEPFVIDGHIDITSCELACAHQSFSYLIGDMRGASFSSWLNIFRAWSYVCWAPMSWVIRPSK